MQQQIHSSRGTAAAVLQQLCQRKKQLGMPVHVEGVLQLLREGLDLGALLQQLAAQAVHLVLQDVDVGHAVLQDVQLPPRLPQLQLQQPQLIQPAATGTASRENPEILPPQVYTLTHYVLHAVLDTLSPASGQLDALNTGRREHSLA